MSSSHLHTIVIKYKDDEQSLKRFEVNAERITEPCSRQFLIIQLKDVSSCQSGIIVKDDLDINASETDQQNQNNPRTMRKYVHLYRGRTEAILRNLVENKDQMLETFVQQLLEHNVKLNEVDLQRNQLLFEVLLKGQADIGETMDMCLTPFNYWLVEESKPSSFKPSSPTLYDGVGNNLESHEETVLDSNDSKSKGKECDTVTSDEHVEDPSDQETVLDMNSEEIENYKHKFFDERHLKIDDHEPVRLTSSDSGKLSGIEKLLSDQKLESAETALKEKTRKRQVQVESSNIEDSTKSSGRENDSIGNDSDFKDFKNLSKVGDDTDVYGRTTEKAPASYSGTEKSSERRLAELNSRNAVSDMNMDRNEFIIEGGEQEHEDEKTWINETDMTITFKTMLEVLLKQTICGNSVAIQQFREVYVKLLSDASAFYKYHYYVESTPKELILLLVAGLKGEKGAKRLLLEYTQLNHDHSVKSRRTDAHPRFDAHPERYRNEKSKKWEGGSPIKDCDKSGRTSPDGNENELVPTNNKKGTVEVTDGELKARVTGKMPGEGSQSPFFHVDTPEADGLVVEQGNVNPHNSHLSNMVSPNISSTETLGGGSRDDGNATDDDSDFSCEDFSNSYPGMRTTPDGSNANSRRGGGMGASGEAPSTADRYKAFLKSWNINLGDNGDECLCSALQDCESEQNLAPSTMFLLDLSKSMQHGDKITQMKEEVRSILQEAGSKHLRGHMSETYGVAVFGNKTEVLLYPTVDLHKVQETLELQRFNEADGRSPLGLGLLLCTCVWFSEKGTGGAVWLHGRKIKPRIIAITDMKMNEIASRSGMVRGTGETEEDEFEPESDEIIEVKNELIQIALKLQKIGIPVYVVPIGDTRQVSSHLEGAIKMTGGKIIDKNRGQLGRQTWQQILACNILKSLATDWGNLSDENFQLMMAMYTGDNPEDKETIQRIIIERQERERKEEDIRSLLRQTGEPGEQLWRELPLGERVRGEPDANLTGTVIGHLPERKILVQWDHSPTGELESREMTGLREGTPRDCGEYFGETHLVGSRVRKICCSNGADGGAPSSIMNDTGVGTVLTLSALQPNVVYVAWKDDQIRRHSVFDICRFQEQDPGYQYNHYWLFCDNGQWQPFPRDVSKTIEGRQESHPTVKTILIMLAGQQYRLSFRKNQMSSTRSQNVSYSIHRQAMIPS